MRGAPVADQRRWNWLGVSPTSSRNRVLNEPRLENPTAWQTSVTVRLVARSRSWARSTRRRDRWAAGGGGGSGGPPGRPRGGVAHRPSFYPRRSWTYLSDLPEMERDKSTIGGV